MKPTKLGMTILSVLVIVLLSKESARADKLLLGGRTASMGGASAAYGRDSAMSYINPAGLGLVPHHSLSLSANMYRYNSYTIDKFFYHGTVNSDFLDSAGLDLPTVGNDGLESSGFEGFPGAVSALWHFGEDQPDATHQVLSMSIIVPNHDRKIYVGGFELDFPALDPLMENVVIDEKLAFIFDRTEYLMGPGYALRVGPVRLGATFFLHYSEAIQSFETSSKTSMSIGYLDTHATAVNEGYCLGFQPVFGAQVKVLDGLALGVSFAPETIYLSSSAHVTSEYTLSSMDENFVQTTDETGTWEYRKPMRIRAGIGYETPREWALALDAEITMSQEPYLKNKYDITETTQDQGSPPVVNEETDEITRDRDGVINLYFGGEVFLNSMIALRGGCFIEPPTIPNFVEEKSEILDISTYRIGGTLGLGMESDVGETTFGIGFSTGKSETVAPDVFSQYPTETYHTVDVDYYTVTFFLSGTVDFEEFGTALELIRDPSAVFDLGDKKPITLSSLDRRLSKFEANPDINVLKTEVVYYYQIGRYQYDEFFERVAKIKASIRLTQLLLIRIRERLKSLDPQATTSEDIEKLVQRINQRNLSIDNVQGTQAIKDMVAATNVVREVLVKLSRDIAELPKLGNRLIEQAKEDLSGPEAVRATAIVNGLSATIGEAYEVIQEMPALLSELSETTEALDRLYLLNPDLRPNPVQEVQPGLEELQPQTVPQPTAPQETPDASEQQDRLTEPKQPAPGNDKP